TGEVTYRYQPFGSFTVGVNYNDVRLPDSYGKDQLTLISSRLDLTFTDKLFLTTFVQYNDKADNINLNARFQWRFKPASDFFVVYTENYLPEHLKSKNRALVVKLTYWFNL
ncbi:MAG TPA: hydrolase, partial [Cyclobacteriaceae bacterium]|nr:hydrolase [Cyclobacteriaceae bacterium]